MLELSYVGLAAGEKRYRRDFLTGALVDRAVQVASADLIWRVSCLVIGMHKSCYSAFGPCGVYVAQCKRVRCKCR